MTRHSYFTLYGILTTALVGLLPFSALADGGVATSARSVGEQVAYVPPLMAIVSYVIGTFFAVRGLFALKGFIEKPDDTPVTRVIAYAGLASLLIFLPYSIDVVANTIGSSESMGITVESTAQSFKNTASQCSDDKTIGNVFCNLTEQMGIFPAFLSVISYVMAAVITLIGLLNLKNYGDDPSAVPLRSILMKFVFAVMLISLPLTMQAFITTITGAKSIDEAQAIKRAPRAYAGSSIRGDKVD
jgi:hypothetical protein